MNSNVRYLLLFGACICIAILFFTWRVRPSMEKNPAESPPQNSWSGTKILDSDASDPGIKQISLKDETREQAIQTWWKRREADKVADWKVPIRFYGRVVDTQNRPVAGAHIRFEWTDLSPKGTSESRTVSDGQGNFSLSAVRGKNLGVYVTKQGYYTPKGISVASFEFADPSEKTYYEPDPESPVLFTLRARGKGERLVHKSAEVMLPGDGTAVLIDLDSGRSAANGQLEIRSWKPWPPRPMSPPYDWKVSLELKSGGLNAFQDEFPFEAPQTGYSESYVIDMPASAAGGWRVSVDRDLYFVYGEPKRYGRMKLHTDGSSRYVLIDYLVNPSGSPRLEEASDDSDER